MVSKKILLTTGNEDRISSLPDGVLCHILSFLPTKYSVRTRVLSTRWNHLFAFVPNLDFEYSPFTNNIRIFLDFVNYVLLLYNAPRINKFRFHFSNSGQPPERCLTVPWISAAIRRHVQEIDVGIHFSLPPTLPRELFSCKTLTTLKLCGEFRILLPHSVCLPCLRTCSLQNVCFDNDSASRFFKSCPVLEHLYLIIWEVGDGVEFLDISVPTLKRLTLIPLSDSYQLVFNLPNLLYFRYEGPAENGFLGLETLKSVVDVCISYEPISYTRDGVVVELVCATCHVRKLHLNLDATEAFVRSNHSLPTFNNLTRLSFAVISSLSSRLLLGLLDNSPRLEFLSFNQDVENEDEEDIEYSYWLPEHVPMCVSTHLREIEFSCFSKWEYYFMIVEYLKNAGVLEKMTIESSFSCEEKFEVTKRVVDLPMCSAACKVVIELVDGEED